MTDPTADHEPYYRSDLVLVHELGFGAHADRCAPGIVGLLEPVRQRRGLVLEWAVAPERSPATWSRPAIVCFATDASPAMLALARREGPGAEEVRQLILPDDPLPRANAVVSVGHMVNYLLVGSGWMEPAHAGCVLGSDGSRRIQKDRLNNYRDDQGPYERHGRAFRPRRSGPPGEGAAVPADQPAGGLSKVNRAPA